MQAWQATVQDEAGNVVVNPAVTVYKGDGVTLATIYDEAGGVKLNPFNGTLEGFVQFWAQPGQYKIEGASGADRTEVWDWSPDYRQITPDDFGARGDGVTDDTVPVQAWVNYLRDNELEGFISKFYVVSSVDTWPSKAYGIVGIGDRQCGFIIRNPNRSGIGINFTHPTNPSTRGKQYQLKDFGVTAEEGTKACLMEHRFASADKWQRIRVSGYHGATGVRLEKCWNVDISELSIWGCGHNVPVKNVPEGARFSIAAGTAPLTSNVPVFGPEDVGRYITLAASASTTPQTFLITGYNDSQSVAVAEPRKRTYTNVPGTFGGVRGSMIAGENILQLEADVLTSDDIGRKVYVMGASLNGAMPRPLPARITAVSGTNITLDAAATRGVDFAELIFDPAADFGDNDYTVTQKTNDFNCADLHVEHHKGCGLVVTGVTLNFPNIKLHAFGHDKINADATNVQMMAYDAAGMLYGSFQQVVAANKGRVLIAGMDQILTMPLFEVLMAHDIPTIAMYDCDDGGALDIGTVKGIGGDQNQNAIDGTFEVEVPAFVKASMVGAPGQSYRLLNVQIP